MPNRKSPPGTALVIGGGVIGLSVALALQARGVATTLIDPGDPDRAASWGNAGHIATEQIEPLASGKAICSAWGRLFWRGGAVSLPLSGIGAWLPFAIRMAAASRRHRFEAGKAALSALMAGAMDSWRQMLARAGAGELLAEHGHFIVWESEAGARAGRATWAATDTGTARWRDASAEELDQIARLLNRRPVGAILFEGSGQILDLPRLAEALTGAFERGGGVVRPGAVRRLLVEDERASAQTADGVELSADALVIAAGHGSAALLRPLGHKVPMIAERGYHIQTDRHDWPGELPPLVFEERSMIVTRFDSGLRAASFVEFTRAGRPADRAKWRRLRDHVRALGLRFEEPMREWMGVRPTLPDYLPAIGRSPRAANLYYAFGHQHLGLTLAAVTADSVAGLIAGDAVEYAKATNDLKPFGLGRFD